MSRNWIQPNPTQSKSPCHSRRPITLPACPGTYKQAPTAIASRFCIRHGRIHCPLSPYPADRSTAGRRPAVYSTVHLLGAFTTEQRRRGESAVCDRTYQRLLRTLISSDRSAPFAFSSVRPHRHSFSDLWTYIK